MRALLAILLALAASSAQAAALSTIGTFCGTYPDQCRKGTMSLLASKGTDANMYMVEIDQTTGLLPVSATATFNSEGTPGSAVPTKALYAAGTDGTNLRGLKTDTAGVLATSNNNLPTTVDTNTGAAGASTPRVVLATRHEAVATPLAVQLSNGTNAVAYGTGADGATVQRATLSTRHETMSTPLAAELSNGTAAAAFGAGAAGSTVLRVVAASDSSAGAGRAFGDSVRYTYVTAAVTTSAYVQMIASTAAAINCVTIFDSSGQTLKLAVGGAGSEVDKLIIPPGGLSGCIPLAIPASSRISLKALSATTGAIGEFNLTGLN